MKVQKDFLLKDILWYKIGGRTKYLLEVASKEDLLEAVEFIHKEKIQKVFVIGIGANLLFTDDYFDGAVIQMKTPKKSTITLLSGGKIEAFAGEILDSVITFSFDHRLLGLEWAGGLPGTIGAAVRGNVGAYGGEIKDSFIEADAVKITKNGVEVVTLSKEQMAFHYRDSFVKHNREYILTSVRLHLQKGNNVTLEKAKDTYYSNIAHRKDNHPLHLPNTGSVFKNIRKKEEVEKVLSVFPDLKEQVEKKWYGKVAVAAIIERFGMKNHRVGNAQISDKHALFILNLGDAKARDVIQVIDDVQKKFQETFGFSLETEVEIVR